MCCLFFCHREAIKDIFAWIWNKCNSGNTYDIRYFVFCIPYSALTTSFMLHLGCVWWVDDVWLPNSLSVTLSLSILTRIGEKMRWKSSRVHIQTGTSLARCCHGQTRFDLLSSHMLQRNLGSSAWSTTSQMSSLTLVFLLFFFSSLSSLHYLTFFAHFLIVFSWSHYPLICGLSCVLLWVGWLEPSAPAWGSPRPHCHRLATPTTLARVSFNFPSKT